MKIKSLVTNKDIIFPITTGKVYNVIREDGAHYFILCDNGKQFGFWKDKFIKVPNKINLPKAVI